MTGLVFAWPGLPEYAARCIRAVIERRSAPVTVAPDPMIMPVLTVPGNAFQAWDDWTKTGTRRMGLYLHHDKKLDAPSGTARMTAEKIAEARGGGAGTRSSANSRPTPASVSRLSQRR